MYINYYTVHVLTNFKFSSSANSLKLVKLSAGSTAVEVSPNSSSSNSPPTVLPVDGASSDLRDFFPPLLDDFFPSLVAFFLLFVAPVGVCSMGVASSDTYSNSEL